MELYVLCLFSILDLHHANVQDQKPLSIRLLLFFFWEAFMLLGWGLQVSSGSNRYRVRDLSQ